MLCTTKIIRDALSIIDAWDWHDHLSRLACLDRIPRSAARLVKQISKFIHVSNYMLEVLRWLPVRQRIEYRVAFLVWRCQLGLAPSYLLDLCRPVSTIRSSRSLRSAGKGCSQSYLS